MKPSRRFFCLILILCLVSAQGTLLAQAVETVTDTDNDTTENASLSIETNIANVEVYLDGVYQGLAPLTITGIAPGPRRLEFFKTGYYRKASTVRITRGKKTSVYTELVPITGVLSITDAPDGAQFAIDQKSYGQNRIELHEGEHTVIVRAFGYTEKKETVMVFRGIDNLFSGKLEKAPFEATALHPVRAAFNPENPANLGKGELTFTVTGPGKGRLTIADSFGKIVQTCEFAHFTTWRQTASWDGKDSSGANLSDGVYTVTLEAAGTGDASVMNLSTTITIDRSIRYPLTGLLGGTGATGQVISASLMPAGGSLLAVDIDYASGSIMPGISLSVGVLQNLEAGFRVGALREASGTATADVVGTIKAGLASGNFHAAARLAYSALITSNTTIDGVGKRGIAFGPALEWRAGDFALGGDAGILFGDARGLFSNPELSASAGLSARYAGHFFGIGAWGSVETSAFGPDFQIPETIDTGARADFFVPSTNLVLSVKAGWRLENLANGTFVIGGGFGTLF